MKIIFSDTDQNVVRNAMNSIDSSKYEGIEKKKDPNAKDPEPVSTLIYHYEHGEDMLQRLTVLANGLTTMKGTFDERDIDELFPGEGKKMLKMMISADIVINVGYEKFKAI
jgi:hypothetical protein